MRLARRLVFAYLCLIVLLALVAVLANEVPRELLTGWFSFIRENATRMEVTTEAVVTGLVVVGLLTIIVHGLIRSWRRRAADEGKRRWPIRATFAILLLVGISFCAGLAAVGITKETPRALHAIKGDKTSDRKMRSEAEVRPVAEQNFWQVGIALQQHAEEQGTLPLATAFGPNGRAMHGWHYSLLPYVEQNGLFRAIDPTKPWDHSDNEKYFRVEVRPFLHPVVRSTHDSAGYSITTYAANVHVMGGSEPRRLSDFANGASNVLLIGECYGYLKPWGYPLNVRDPKLGLKRDPDGFGGPWKAGTMFLMADGSVRTFRDDADPEFLKLLAEPGR
jgi:hypothetical protein